MCGIAGFAGEGTRQDLRRMTNALRSRGPDGEGFHVDQHLHVFLGHRRLAIVDVADGRQPMWNENGTVAVIFNGEIYNHKELRRALVECGHVFATSHSDTEVLVHGYEEWGSELPSKLNGMFAFAIFDRQRKRLFLARDRFAEKPLYYSHKTGTFAFASELTSLALHPNVPNSPDLLALQKLFAYGYIPAPFAAITGTKKLPGGHWLSYDLMTETYRTECYWRFLLQPDDGISDSHEPQLVDECASLISQAVKRRLMSDVPLGVFLSGGLDSSTIAASLATFTSPANIKTFTVGFTERSFDESPHARMVSKHLGTEHFERLLDIDLARDLMPDVLSRMDEPLGDASILPTHLLSSFTREHVTVALSGDGGDELFAGYDPFVALGLARVYEKIMPKMSHKGVRRLVDLMPISEGNMGLDFKLRRTLMGLSYGRSTWVPVWMAPMDPADMKDLFHAPLNFDELYGDAISLWERDPTKSVVDRALEFFTQFYLQDDILAKVDRAAMMCSLESRAVFLDNDLVDFCQRLPARFKLRNGERKYLLKRVARRLLPDSIVNRKKKGFGIPLGAWLKTIPSEPPMSPLSGVSTEFARHRFAEHRAGARDHRLFLWNWLAAQALQNRWTSAGN